MKSLGNRITGNFNKKDINYKPNRNLEDLINLTCESISYEEYQNSKFSKPPYSFTVLNGSMHWEDSSKISTPQEWLGIYRYAPDYGKHWKSLPVDCFKHCRSGNVLDFGAGVGTPWINIPEEVTLYLYEANLQMANELKEIYQSHHNVIVVTSFKDIKDVKFDYIYSHDVIEHVRYVNEHLDILYYLGNDKNCIYNLLVDVGFSPNHVLNLHKDSILNNFWSSQIAFGK